MDTNKLRKYASEFLCEIGRLCEQAQNEDDFEDLVEIAQDVVEAMPRKLVLLDYYTRQNIKDNIPDEHDEDTQFINEVIDNLCIEFDYDYINDSILETAEELEDKNKGVNDEIKTVQIL